MKLVENTNESGRWKRVRDFSQGGVLLCIWEWSMLAGKARTKLIQFYSGHSFNFIAFLSPISADGAVKFLLFGENSDQP